MESSPFHLNKWFLDFVGNDGEAMIFYAAKLSWKGLAVHYGSWLQYHPGTGVQEKSHFGNVSFPEKKDELISWHDPEFEVSGIWEGVEQPLQARLFESERGHLDWHCHQPASRVRLQIKDQIIEGEGYAEQLILTAPPWQIPMHDLRWGRFRSPDVTMVWIELRKESRPQWVWLNGERIGNCSIEDDHLSSPDPDFELKLDRRVVLESENKISSVVGKLLHYLPGFQRLIPIPFLMAYQKKWFSKAEFQYKGGIVTQGNAIHEWVNFNPRNL